MTLVKVTRPVAVLLVLVCALAPLVREASLMVYTGVLVWSSPLAPLVTTTTGLRAAMVIGVVGVTVSLLADRRVGRPTTFSFVLAGIALAGLCGLAVPAFLR